MLAIKSEILFEGNNSVVYYQEKNAYPTPIALKVSKQTYSGPESPDSVYNEYEI
ncbi:MAG: hypothetical protein HC880_08385, partial [Bacteroidia bacterium]|nr:hypothetical protein [Bacteroidia bacterium]